MISGWFVRGLVYYNYLSYTVPTSIENSTVMRVVKEAARSSSYSCSRSRKLVRSGPWRWFLRNLLAWFYACSGINFALCRADVLSFSLSSDTADSILAVSPLCAGSMQQQRRIWFIVAGLGGHLNGFFSFYYRSRASLFESV